MDKLVRITKNITFEDLRSGRKSPIDVYQEQMESWLIRPLEQLADDKNNSFENGYAMLGLELLFFEPHGKYLLGNSINGSRNTFDCGFNSFLKYLLDSELVNNEIYNKIQGINFYDISRCGIFHGMTIKTGLLIDSIHMRDKEVFYHSPINNGILVSPWNLLKSLKDYLEVYINDIKQNPEREKAQKFQTTFNSLFEY